MFNQSSNALSKILGRTNNVVGEYAEYLVCKYLNGEMLSPSNKSADIQDRDGKLYQVKASGYSGDADPLSGHIDPPSRMMVHRTLMTDNFTVFFLNFHLFYGNVCIKKVMATPVLCKH